MASSRSLHDLLALFDEAALLASLRSRGAPAGAARLITGRVHRLGLPWAGADLSSSEAARAVLQALLEQAVDASGALEEGAGPGGVSVARLEAFVAAATRLGWDDERRAGLVVRQLGITEARVMAYGLLELSLSSTKREVKAAHRRAAKRLHPDRLVRSAPAFRAGAERQLARLNVARDLLLRDEGVVLSGGDDVTLEAPDFDPEDAPTVMWGEPEVEEDAETVVLDDVSVDAELLWR
jgi:hypothetical protein